MNESTPSVAPVALPNRRVVSNMILVLAGRLVSLFGTFIYNFAISLYVLRVTGSAMNFATTLVFSIVPRVLLAPLAGALADRLNRKTMAVGTDFISGVIVLALFFLSGHIGLQLPLIYATAVLLSVANTFFTVTIDAALPNLVDDSRLNRINSLNHSITSLTQIVAPVVGGIVFALVDIRLFLLINGLSFIISAISEYFIDFNLCRRGGEVSSKTKVWRDIREGFGYLRKNPVLFYLASYAVFLNFFSSMGFSVAFPYIANNVVRFSSSQYGVIAALFPGGILIGSLLLSALPEFERKYRSIVWGLLGVAVGCMLIGVPALPVMLAQNRWMLFGFLAVVLTLAGICNCLINIPVFVYMQRVTLDNYRGRVFGLLDTACMAITPVGFALAGMLIEFWPPWLIPVLSGLGMLGIWLIVVGNKSLRHI